MAGLSRYNVSNEQADIQGGVLKNNLNITTPQQLDDLENILLRDTYTHFFTLLAQREIVFNLSLLYEIHAYFLKTLYPWAGNTRTVDISKDGILFAPIRHLKISLKDLKRLIEQHIPQTTDTKKIIAEKLAIIHNEMNVVHPFRDGNGRTIRLFIDLLVTSVDYQLINWSVGTKKIYIEACKQGIYGNHNPMRRYIYRGLLKKK